MSTRHAANAARADKSHTECVGSKERVVVLVVIVVVVVLIHTSQLQLSITRSLRMSEFFVISCIIRINIRLCYRTFPSLQRRFS